jgi:peptide-methionine (R)-S-oxide reductase
LKQRQFIMEINRRQVLITTLGIMGAVPLTQYLLQRKETPEVSMSTTSSDQYPVVKTDAEWKAELTPEQFRVLRNHGTERAGTSPLDKTYSEGVYRCAGCGQPLFTSDTKFNSGTGWPSFFAPMDDAIGTTSDRSLFMVRTEVHCSQCGGHLGHVFNDGPNPTGLRYCINGVALDFDAAQAG